MVQKKSNVLDKPVSHQKSSTATAPTGVGNSSNNVSADIDVKKLTVRIFIWFGSFQLFELQYYLKLDIYIINSLVCLFVCLFVCPQATGHSF